jgi:hypothetical protein
MLICCVLYQTLQCAQGEFLDQKPHFCKGDCPEYEVS